MRKWADNYEECLSFAKDFLEYYLNEKVNVNGDYKKEVIVNLCCNEKYDLYFIIWNRNPANEDSKADIYPEIVISTKYKDGYTSDAVQSKCEIKNGFFYLYGTGSNKNGEKSEKRIVWDKFCEKYGAKNKRIQIPMGKAKEALKEYWDMLIPVIKGENNASTNGASIEERIKEALSNNPQIVLTGAPGTGKTYSARRYVAKQLGWDETKDLNDFLEGNPRFKFVQFHSGYDYTDFVQGYKPVIANNEMTFVLTDGIFKRFCDVANKDQENDYYFIIDEINRADLSRVFGELFFGLEKDYRGTPMTTQYGDTMIIPENVKIIGTMNDVDRGVETIDFALRRRFIWIEVEASTSEHLADEVGLKNNMQKLNEAVRKKLGSEYEIGGAYFKDETDKQKIWDNRIKPLLNEYLRGKKDKQTVLNTFEDAYNLKTPKSDE